MKTKMFCLDNDIPKHELNSVQMIPLLIMVRQLITINIT